MSEKVHTLDDALEKAGTNRRELERCMRQEIWGRKTKEFSIEWIMRVRKIVEQMGCEKEYEQLHDKIRDAIITNPLGNL